MNLGAKTAAGIIACTIMFHLPATASARPEGGFFGDGPMGDRPTSAVLDMLNQRLNLTAEQQQKMAQILDQARDRLKTPAQQAKSVLLDAKKQAAAILTDEQKSKVDGMKNSVKQGLVGFARDHAPELRQELKSAGDEVRMRVALGALDLNEEQRAKLKDIAKSVKEKRQAIMKDIQPKMEQLGKEAKEQISGVLTPEQREQLEKRVQEMPKPGERFGRAGLDGPGGPGAPGGAAGLFGPGARGEERAVFGKWRQRMQPGAADGMPSPPPAPPVPPRAPKSAAHTPEDAALMELFK